MRFVILGPVMAYGKDGQVPLGPPKRRLLLALLLTSGERAVPLETAVQAVWGGNPPASAVQNLYQHISHLRQVLGHDTIAGQGRPGYTVAGLPGNLDAHTFEDLAERGSRALAGGDAPTAARSLRQALAMWRGPAFGDLAGEPALHQEAERLEELRLAALENRIEADLTLGLHEPAIAELLVLTRSHPYRERFVTQLMHGLRVAQRASEALEVYRRTRALFVEELGIEPGPVLRRLHQAILTGEPYTTGPSAGSVRPSAIGPAAPDDEPALAGVAVPHELPAGVARFVGRRAQLRELDRLLPRTTDRTPPTVIVAAVVGTAGVGKTALAVHWAHRVAHRFPDGRLYLNMHGYSAESPRQPLHAVSALLRSLGMPAEQIPVDLAEAAARYRSLIAGRRMLIVLDNVRSAAQIRPLLPGEGASFVLVTSRDRLTGLVAQDGACRLTLGVMTEKESVALLARTLGAGRVHHEPQAAAALAARCAHLPLSLCIAAALLSDHPKQDITHFVGQLAGGEALAGLTVDGQEDGEIAVRAAFDLSYQALDPSLRSVFRGLGLVGCPDFTAEAVGAQTGAEPAAADRALRRLAAAHLVEESQPGRYTLHDLLREYASRLATTTDDEETLAAARRRLCDWYLTTVTTAQRLLHAGQRQSPPEDFVGHAPPALTDYDSALAWLDAERHNIVEVVKCASRHGLDAICVHLADRLRGYFDLRRHTADWETVARLARETAARGGDETLHPIALHGAAHLGFVLARYAQAITCVKELMALTPADAPAKARADLMCNLGYLLTRVGRTAEAESTLDEARVLARTAGSTASQAAILLNLANLHLDCGSLAEGRTAALTALRLSRNSDEPRWVAMSLGTLGELAQLQGSYAEAISYFDDCLEMHRRQGDRPGELASLSWLARTCLDLGRWEECHHNASAARDLAREIGDRHQLVHSVTVLAAHSRATGDLEAALSTSRTALGMAAELGDPYLECDAALEAAHAAAGTGSQAEQLARRALTIARRCRFRLLEGRALTLLATLAHERADHHAAVEQAFHALAVHRSTGHRLGEAHTHALLGQALRAAGDPRAEEHGRAAERTLADLGLTGRLKS
ncbi:AfsR/SARP family transcriptional regulator [Nonomuraea soli]|uniref:DNA-binding SARP family transcriptional activator/tetratricopeptide (TPR) repeat protein n=1 Tax=Nonomuraea soli TaxID=1032476 RepID=A0A7W0HR72_9ACTN|nr:BTAD domain-containing putative transcriptional regulator [Nonomuraea soli]MBA2892552.1 DNA-binding SARP family transcriptional activator/tetratricopeptide (TPR) repeat protein [Nonomuraea soli]